MALSENAVFVYGTLKPGGRYWPEFCEGKVAHTFPAKLRGVLYDMHVGYPGMRCQDSGWVLGYVLTFHRETDFARLDTLEGYAPGRPVEANEYIRLKRPCFTREGDALGDVWAYEITEWMMRKMGATQIPGGNWPV